MSIDSVYEQWERQVTQKAFEQGYAEGFELERESTVKRMLRLLYEARFGALPDALTATIEATHDVATLERWIILAGTRSPEEVTAAVQAGEE
jgi:flagellar biosynthesis/type III secretory pathway protein FliH